MWCASSGPLASYGVGVRTGGDDNFPQKVEQVFPRGKSEEDCIIQLTCPMHMHTSSLGPPAAGVETDSGNVAQFLNVLDALVSSTLKRSSTPPLRVRIIFTLVYCSCRSLRTRRSALF